MSGDDANSAVSAGDDPRPTPPESPDPLDCCGDGCDPCVYDYYDEALTAYREALAAWRLRHPDAETSSSGS